MRKWQGWVQVWIMGILILNLTTLSHASVRLEGTLMGYFLGTEGNLGVREVVLAFPGKEPIREHLLPLRSGYYLRLVVHSDRPIRSIRLLSAQGQVLWQQQYSTGTTQACLPGQAEEGWIGVRGENGGRVRVEVGYAGGGHEAVSPSSSALLGKVLPLVVDWLDFVRLAEAMHLVKEKRKDIFPGFSLEKVPFALEGGGGQWVLINHPKPPKGFVPYTGPLPKVPFRMRVYIGKELPKGPEEGGGWLARINGVWTAGLKYYPCWWMLTGCALPGYEVTRQPPALDRLEAIIHEAFHVWWFERIPMRFEEASLLPRSELFLTLKALERECLARAVESKGEEGKQWVKAFLFERERRQKAEGRKAPIVANERWQELVEGVASYVGEKAMAAGKAQDYHPLEAMKADDDFGGYELKWDGKSLGQAIWEAWGARGWPYASGRAQIALLDRYVPDWKSKVLTGKDVEELLIQAVKGSPLPSPEVMKAVEQQQITLRKVQSNLQRKKPLYYPAKPSGGTVKVWLYLPEALVQWVERMLRSWKDTVPGLNFAMPGLECHIGMPDIVEVKRSRIGFFWDIRKPLMIWCYPDGRGRIQGEGLEVLGQIAVAWNKRGIHVHFVERHSNRWGGISMKSKTQYATILSSRFLKALASGKHPMAGQEAITMQGSITGVFLNAITTQLEWLTLPVPEDTGEYCYVDGEQYRLRATFATSLGMLSTQDFILHTRFGDDPTKSPVISKTVWRVSINPEQIHIGRRVGKVGIMVKNPDNVWLDIRGINFPIRRILPSGQLTVKVYLTDDDKTSPAHQPFAGVQVEVYIKEKFKASRLTDANGDAKFEKVAPGEYRTRALKNQAIPACTEVNDTTTVLKDQGNSTSLYLYSHKPIKGRAMEQTGGGPLPLSGAKAALYRGDQKLSSDYTSGTDGYFAIDPLAIDGILANNGSGAYTVKVYPPVRSMMRVSPYPGVSDVALTRCQRTQSADECSRRATVDAGIFSFTYMPISPQAVY